MKRKVTKKVKGFFGYESSAGLKANVQRQDYFNKSMVLGGVNQTIIEEDPEGLDDGEDGVQDDMYNSVMVDNMGTRGVIEYLDGPPITTPPRSSLQAITSLGSGSKTQRNVVLSQDSFMSP